MGRSIGMWWLRYWAAATVHGVTPRKCATGKSRCAKALAVACAAVIPVFAACSDSSGSNSPGAPQSPAPTQASTHGPMFPECGGISDQTLAEQTRVTGLVNTARNSAGCPKTVEGTAAKSGSGDVPRNDDSAKQYPNLLKECEVLTEDILAKTVGADPLDIQSTFVGAVCRWQAANPAGLIDITRFWYEQGSLDNEKKVGQNLKYQIENPSIAGVPSIAIKPKS